MDGSGLGSDDVAAVTNGKKPALSVIIPAYNVAGYIHRCMATIQALTMPDIEIIIVDDGSTDESPGLCDEIARGDSRVTLLHQANAGLSEARNAGLAKARGDYVIFVDADDYVLPDALMAAVKDAIRDNPDIIVGGAFIVNLDGLLHERRAIAKSGCVSSGPAYLEAALSRGRMYMCAPYNMYKRALLISAGIRFEPSLYHEDELWTPQVFLAAQRVQCASPFYYHVTRPGSIMTGDNHIQRSRDLQTVVRLLALQVDALPESQLKRLLNDNLVSLFLSAIYVGRVSGSPTDWSRTPISLQRRALSMRNTLRAHLYLANPSAYILANTTTKCSAGLVAAVREKVKQGAHR